jgi:DNA-binding NarL/FixJ family response regulator
VIFRGLEIDMNGDSPIRVRVIHTDPVLQAALSIALGRIAGVLVDRAEDGRLPLTEVDVVMADYDRGVELLPISGSSWAMKTTPKVLIVTTDDRESAVSTALRHGARGYLLAGNSLAELAAALHDVHEGRVHLDPRVAQRVAEGLYRESLTSREEDVLRQVVEGRCNKDIAARLDVALGTVKSHLRSIFGKLEVSSRTQAIAAAAQRGVLRPSSIEPARVQIAVSAHLGAPWEPHLAQVWNARQQDVGDID